MTLEEFQEKYCALCGTQRCLGVYDKELREGCQHYREVFLKESHCPRGNMTFLECLDGLMDVEYHLNCPCCGYFWWSENPFPDFCPQCKVKR